MKRSCNVLIMSLTNADVKRSKFLRSSLTRAVFVITGPVYHQNRLPCKQKYRANRISNRSNEAQCYGSGHEMETSFRNLGHKCRFVSWRWHCTLPILP